MRYLLHKVFGCFPFWRTTEANRTCSFCKRSQHLKMDYETGVIFWMND